MLLSALAQISKLISLRKRRILSKTFIESQFQQLSPYMDDLKTFSK